MVDHTTYQVVKRAHVVDEAEASESERGRLMDLAARSMTAKPYFVFIFVTIRGTNAYSLQCTSFREEAKSRFNYNSEKKERNGG
jgi:hypothetical protein